MRLTRYVSVLLPLFWGEVRLF